MSKEVDTLKEVDTFPVKLFKDYADDFQIVSGLSALTCLAILATRNLSRAQQYLTGGLAFTATVILLASRHALKKDPEAELDALVEKVKTAVLASDLREKLVDEVKDLRKKVVEEVKNALLGDDAIRDALSEEAAVKVTTNLLFKAGLVSETSNSLLNETRLKDDVITAVQKKLQDDPQFANGVKVAIDAAAGKLEAERKRQLALQEKNKEALILYQQAVNRPSQQLLQILSMHKSNTEEQGKNEDVKKKKKGDLDWVDEQWNDETVKRMLSNFAGVNRNQISHLFGKQDKKDASKQRLARAFILQLLDFGVRIVANLSQDPTCQTVRSATTDKLFDQWEPKLGKGFKPCALINSKIVIDGSKKGTLVFENDKTLTKGDYNNNQDIIEVLPWMSNRILEIEDGRGEVAIPFLLPGEILTGMLDSLSFYEVVFTPELKNKSWKITLTPKAEARQFALEMAKRGEVVGTNDDNNNNNKGPTIEETD